MRRRSEKGVQEFMQRTTGWDVRSQIRFMSESGRDVHSIVSLIGVRLVLLNL